MGTRTRETGRGGRGFRTEFRREFLQGVARGTEGECQKRRGISVSVRSAQRRVVVALTIAHRGLDGDMGKHRMQIQVDSMLPKATNAPVSVCERVNEFDLIVAKRGTKQKRHFLVAGDKIQQVLHELRYACCGRRHVCHVISLENADAATAKTPSLIGKPFHQHRMSREQVPRSGGKPSRRGFVRTKGVGDLGDRRS